VTGLAVIGEHLYVGSRSQNRTFVYDLPNLWGRTGSTSFGGGSLTRDIERTAEGLTWVASDREEMPLCLLAENGQVLTVVDPDVVPSAAGVALDDEGYLWVSVQNGDILRLEVTLPE